MPTRRVRNFACILIASWAIACGSPSPAPTDQTPKETQRVLDLGDRQLVVEDPGQTPRRRLSYAGAHERRVRIGMSQRKPAAWGGKVMPTFFVVELDWRGQSPTDGPAIHDFVIESVEHPSGEGKGPKKPTPPEMQEVIGKIDAAFLRVRGSVRIEDGRPLQIVSNREQMRLTPDIPTVLDLFLLPLPSTEVGVGARWVTTDSKTKERREYVLSGLDETSATIELERGALDKMLSSLPRVRGRFELRSTAGSEGSTLLLADPLPTHGELEFEVVFEVPGEAEKETVTLYQILTLDTAP